MPLLLFRLLADSMAVSAAVGVAFILRFRFDLLEVSESSPLTIHEHVTAAVLWVLGVLGALTISRLYDEDTLLPGGGELARIGRSHIEAASIFAIFVFLTQSFYVSRSWFGITLVCSLVFLTVERLAVRSLLRALRRKGLYRRQVIIVADDVDGLSALSDSDEFEIVGKLSSAELMTALSAETQDSPRRVSLVVRASDFAENQLWRLVIEAGDKGYPVFVSASVKSVHRDRLTVRRLGDESVIRVSPAAFIGFTGQLKRGLDLVLGTVFFVATIPVMLLISLLVLITSGWPIFYSQERVGAQGRKFTMLKFRTMRRDAESATGARWATPKDDRRTPIGALLRRLSIDELPQLFNVIAGHMSLVGPRPERPVFAEQLSDQHEWYRYRTRIKPGITGLAQSRGFRGQSSIESRVDLDNWYIENWSVSLDLKILFRTFFEVLRGTNAY